MESHELLTGLWYDRMAADGREELLLGGDRRRECMKAVGSTLRAGYCYEAYTEIPLLGPGSLDLSVAEIGQSRKAAGAPFLLGDGFGAAEVFDYHYSHGYFSLGFEFDLSQGEPLSPAVVVFPHRGMIRDDGYWEGAFKSLVLAGRLPDFLRRVKEQPEGFRFSYYGAFRGRPSAPLRMSFKLLKDRTSEYENDPARLARRLRELGVPGIGEEAGGGFAYFVKYPGNLLLDLDLLPDGTFSGKVGLELGMDGTRIGDALPKGFFASRNPSMFTQLEKDGLIDDRWRKAAESCFAVSVDLAEEPVLVMNSIHTLKANFVYGKMGIPKLYTRVDVMKTPPGRG